MTEVDEGASELVEHGSELRARTMRHRITRNFVTGNQRLEFQETGDKKKISGEVFECLTLVRDGISQLRVLFVFFNERPKKTKRVD